MNEWLGIVSIVGFILAFQTRHEPIFDRNGINLIPFFIRNLNLLWQSLLLILIYHGTAYLPKEIWAHILGSAIFVILFFAAVGLSYLEKTLRFFYLATFGIAALAVMTRASNLSYDLLQAIHWTLGVMLFQVLFLGVWQKIRLAHVPAVLEGFPIGLAVAGVTSLGMWIFSVTYY